MSRIELLAPAGSIDILKAAVDAGADAVYTGVGSFNARMNAVNLSEDELYEGCRYAHRRNSRVYLTLNTLVNDYELDEALNTASMAYNSGVDAILVQDIGLASKIHALYPSIPLHASTQMNIFERTAFKELFALGIKRVVLPRELSLEEIKIRSTEAALYGIETEVFVHGAICVCYSGLCLYSSMNKSGSRSGNRGVCAQPCRQEYKVSFNGYPIKEGHLLSPKDRSLIEYVDDLIDAGVASLKIEGRMRDRAYVTTVVDSYRKLIDSYHSTDDNPVQKGIIRNNLLINFNRGGRFSSQFISGSKDPDLLSGEYVGKFGLKLGKITRTDKKQGTIEFTYNNKCPIPDKGDYLSIRSGNKELYSFPAGKIRKTSDFLAVKGLHPDSIAAIKGEPDVYLMNHETVRLTGMNSRKTPITVTVSSDQGALIAEASVISGLNKGITGSYEIGIDPDYNGKVLSSDRIKEQICKTGDTPFKVAEVIFANDPDIPCPVSLINELRRGLIEDLISSVDYEREHTCIREFIPSSSDSKNGDVHSGKISSMYYFPSVRTIKGDLRRDTDIYAFNVYDLMLKMTREKIYAFLDRTDVSVVLVIPDAYHDMMIQSVVRADQELRERYPGRYIGFMDSSVFGAPLKADNEVAHFLSAGANLFNKASLEYASSGATAVSVSYELTPDEITEMLCEYQGHTDTIILHCGGPIPWMHSDFCPLGCNKKNCRECYDKDHVFLEDSTGSNKCVIIPHSADHSSTIYGNPKYVYDDKRAETIASYGYNVIQMYSEI